MKDNDISRTLGQLETQVQNLNQHICDLKHITEKIWDRLFRIEQQHYLWRGGIAAILSVSTLIGMSCDFLIRWLVGRL